MWPTEGGGGGCGDKETPHVQCLPGSDSSKSITHMCLPLH